MADTQVGQVIHFYDKLSVAIVKLTHSIKIGNTLKFQRSDSEFEQPLDSMQKDHQVIQTANKGDEVGIKVNQAVKEGTKVFLVA